MPFYSASKIPLHQKSLLPIKIKGEDSFESSFLQKIYKTHDLAGCGMFKKILKLNA
jgi:hypothetical protein